MPRKKPDCVEAALRELDQQRTQTTQLAPIIQHLGHIQRRFDQREPPTFDDVRKLKQLYRTTPQLLEMARRCERQGSGAELVSFVLFQQALPAAIAVAGRMLQVDVDSIVRKFLAWGREQAGQDVTAMFAPRDDLTADAQWLALEAAARAGGSADKRKAESKTESNGNSSPFPLPENPDVSRLAKYITREWKKRPYETKTSLAKEFTNSDKARAQNLLRQLRSFPQLLERAENERKGRLK